jgi:hypothetical protein
MGGALSAPTLVAMLDGCKSSSSETGSVFSLTPEYKSLLAEIAEIIIPKTDTPGAKEAGVGPFIELMLRDCYSELQQAHFKAGLDKVEEEAKKIGGSFLSLAEDKKIEVIKTMQGLAKAENEANNQKKKAKEVDIESGLVKESQKKKDEAEIPTPFFTLAKELTLFGYFTSEPGATQALDFVPIPGRFDACIKIEPGTKAYAI